MIFGLFVVALSVMEREKIKVHLCNIMVKSSRKRSVVSVGKFQ